MYNTGARPTKLGQPKRLEQDDLLDVKELKYKQNSIICQVGNRKN